jgi:predicted metal-dependent phosphoesterase TrpH
METKKYIDLHTHTFYSDGITTPELSVKAAAINGLDILAITDHDKTGGYEEARKAGEKWNVKIIPGTEVSTDKYHILGLALDINNPNFVNFLKEAAQEQKKVCIRRVNGLRASGVPITLEKIIPIFPDSRLGKMNIWYAMMQDKECQDYFMEKEKQKLTYELYNKYLKDQNGKWIVDKLTNITPERTIKEIHNAGGIAILAHPPLDVKSPEGLEVLLEQGIDGIEVQPRNNGRNQPFIDFAKKNNLLITYGSDYHGGLFGRIMLDNHGENILDERLAIAFNKYIT